MLANSWGFGRIAPRRFEAPKHVVMPRPTEDPSRGGGGPTKGRLWVADVRIPPLAIKGMPSLRFMAAMASLGCWHFSLLTKFQPMKARNIRSSNYSQQEAVFCKVPIECGYAVHQHIVNC